MSNVFGDAPIYQAVCLDLQMVPDLPPMEPLAQAAYDGVLVRRMIRGATATLDIAEHPSIQGEIVPVASTPERQPGDPVRACPARKCKLPDGHDKGVHGRQPPVRTLLGTPRPNRAVRRSRTA